MDTNILQVGEHAFLIEGASPLGRISVSMILILASWVLIGLMLSQKHECFFSELYRPSGFRTFDEEFARG